MRQKAFKMRQAIPTSMRPLVLVRTSQPKQPKHTRENKFCGSSTTKMFAFQILGS